MKKCRDVENLLPLYSEGALSASERHSVEEHLAECAACRTELAYLQKAGQLVDQLSSVEEPPWFQQKIMARIREEAGRKSAAKKWFYPLRIKVPLQVAATIMIAVLAVYIYRSGDEEVKQILPGVSRPALEIKKEPAPAAGPKAGGQALPFRAPGQESTVLRKSKTDKQVVGGIADGSVQKSEAPADKSNAAAETGTSGAKGLAENKDKISAALQTKSNALESAETQMADREKKAEAPAAAKKREFYKMAAPAAPQAVAAPASPPQARVLVRVDDLQAATTAVEKILVQYDVRNISKQPAEGVMILRTDLPARNWEEVLAKLKGIGQVEEKLLPADPDERGIPVLIEIRIR